LRKSQLIIRQLAEHLIATNLSTLAPFLLFEDCNTASTFIIVPPNKSIASNINNILQTKRTIGSETARIKLLNSVQLMPYFDFVGLSESLSEVACHLDDLHKNRVTDSLPWKRHILFIDGLCPALDSIQRRSGLVQANALAASLLRSAAFLSQSHPYVLVLFNLEPSWDIRGGEELKSAFSSLRNNFRRVSLGGKAQETLLAGMDTVVWLHDTVDAGFGSGGQIVEVVKDRTDAHLGHWATWSNPT
jgi:hypothetical protein